MWQAKLESHNFETVTKPSFHLAKFEGHEFRNCNETFFVTNFEFRKCGKPDSKVTISKLQRNHLFNWPNSKVTNFETATNVLGPKFRISKVWQARFEGHTFETATKPSPFHLANCDETFYEYRQHKFRKCGRPDLKVTLSKLRRNHRPFIWPTATKRSTTSTASTNFESVAGQIRRSRFRNCDETNY